ncbi:MAG: TfoX/Sxy family protein [Bacteroidetes bacterium]|nr:TfoX/Sxy family protein [Bacteroidota bacterium]
MAYSKELASRIRKLLSDANVTEEIEMMGGLVFMVNGRMSIGIKQEKGSGLDKLMLKLGQAEITKWADEAECEPVDLGGRKMKAFLYVSAQAFESDAELKTWVDRALQYNLEQEK